jgi:hypothetical protein
VIHLALLIVATAIVAVAALVGLSLLTAVTIKLWKWILGVAVSASLLIASSIVLGPEPTGILVCGTVAALFLALPFLVVRAYRSRVR